MSVSTVKAIINSQTYDLSYNEGSGKWEATITAPSITSYNVNANHYYAVQIQATDDANNVTTVDDTDGTLGDSLKLMVKEKTKPIVTITSPTGSARLTNSKPTISFTLRDEVNGSGIKIDTLSLKFDGGSSINNIATGMTVNSVANGYDCTYACQTALTEGNHTITIDIQDNDGNVATTSTVTFYIDTVAPILNISAPSENAITNNPTCIVSGTTNDETSSPVTVTITVNDVDQGEVTVSAGSFDKSVTLTDGANTIIIKSKDASNLETTITRHITLDEGFPVITNVTLTPNPVDSGITFVITVTVTD